MSAVAWKPLSEETPKDRILLGCWRDARGDDVPVLIRFDPGNLDSNRGFIGVHGSRYGGLGITHYQEIVMPDGTVPNDRVNA